MIPYNPFAAAYLAAWRASMTPNTAQIPLTAPSYAMTPSLFPMYNYQFAAPAVTPAPAVLPTQWPNNSAQIPAAVSVNTK